MTVRSLVETDRLEWNTFVLAHFPPVGAFLQSYEWGDFKEHLFNKGVRYVVEDEGNWIACFHLEIHPLRLGLCYGYAPRGPVLHRDIRDTAREEEVFRKIAECVAQEYPKLAFVRFEPAIMEPLACFASAPFSLPSYYLQPRFNQVIKLLPEGELLASFSSDVRHDIRAAERLGIEVTSTAELNSEQRAAFEAMKRDTQLRSQKGIFPSDTYFANLEELFKDAGAARAAQPRARYFIASNKEGVPVAINMNILFGTTLTYLFGASYTGSRSKRAPAYLHWKTMEYARENGFTHYDLGGVDKQLWPGLTYFKQQFGSEPMAYMGMVDVVFKPSLYKVYNALKKGT